MLLKKIFFILLLILQFNILYSQWKQCPVSIGSINNFTADKETNIKCLISSNQIYTFEGNNWVLLSTLDLPNTSNTILHSVINYDKSIILAVNFFPNAALYKYNIKNKNWDKLDFIINDSFTFNNIISINNIIYVSLTIIKSRNTLPSIFYSLDGGNTWQPDGKGIDFSSVTSLNDILLHDSNLYIATSTGLYRRNVSDTIWQKFNSGLESFLSFSPRSIILFNNSLFISSNFGVFKYNENERIWKSINSGFLNNDSITNGNIINFNNRLITYSTSLTSRRSYIYDNNQLKWLRFHLLDSLSNLKLFENNDTLFIISNQGLYYITDITDTLKLFTNGIHNPRINSLNFEDNQLYAAANNIGVLKYRNHFNKNPEIFRPPFSSAATDILITKDKIIVSYTRGLGLFDKSMNLLYYEPQFHNSNVSTIYKYNNYIYVNTGQSNFICHEDTLIWRKTDLNTAIRQFYYHEGYIYAAGSSTGLYRYSLQNENWEYVSGPFGPQQIQGITAYNNSILVTTRDGLFKYNLIDKQWNKINTPFDNLGFQKITYFKNKVVVNTLFQSGVYVADTSDFIFYQLYNGINTNLFSINNMLIHQDTLFLATTQGIWYRPLSEINTGLAQTNLKSKAGINIYPNPAIGLINIETKTESIKQIKLYNIQGKQVESYDVNNDKFMINTEYFVPSVYIIQVVLNNNELVQEKVVIK
ncbi:MAG: T9SS type A sorting domain-containing protein [Bacteroidia bacterium]